MQAVGGAALRGGGGEVDERGQPHAGREHVRRRHAVLRRAQEPEPRVRAGVPRQPRRRRQQRAAVHLQHHTTTVYSTYCRSAASVVFLVFSTELPTHWMETNLRNKLVSPLHIKLQSTGKKSIKKVVGGSTNRTLSMITSRLGCAFVNHCCRALAAPAQCSSDVTLLPKFSL